MLYQRVTFPVAGPNAPALTAQDLVRLPMLADFATPPQYYAGFGEMVTVTFTFADAVADTNDAPMAPLHISDVTLGDTTNWQILSVSGTNMVTLRSTYAPGATSASLPQ